MLIFRMLGSKGQNAVHACMIRQRLIYIRCTGKGFESEREESIKEMV